MLLALVLPVAPAAGATVGDQDDVHAANVLGTPANPAVDAQDCLGQGQTNPQGLSRYFITVRSTSGLDITNAVGRIIASPGGNVILPGPVSGQTVAPFATSTITMSNGDFESQANDGTQPSCVPAVNDGHPNDLASPPINTLPATAPVDFTAIGGPIAGAPLYNMVITAAGFVPVVVPISVDWRACNPGGATNFICLISMGTINLTPLSASAGRGTIAGSVFAPNGQPLDGAVVVLTDASGLVHTRISGTDCDGRLVAPLGSPPTGFYCFADSVGDKPNPPVSSPPGLVVGAATQAAPTASPNGFVNDSLGLPVGPATVTVVYDVGANALAVFNNCPPPPSGAALPTTPGAPGSICGTLPNTVTVSVQAGQVVGQDVTLQNKFAPAAGIALGASAGAFGYVVNGLGQGVGGVIITASGGGLTAPVVAFCPSPTTGIPNVQGNPPGTCTQTGLWVMPGLPANANITFTITGAQIQAQNVRPALTITQRTTANGTWIDPSWIIVAPGPVPGAIPLPVVGSGILRGTVLDSQGQPFTGAGAFAVLYRLSTRSFAASTAFTGTTPAVRGSALVNGIPVGFFPVGNPVSAIQVPVSASALDAGGNFCFGSGSAFTGGPVGGVSVGCPNPWWAWAP